MVYLNRNLWSTYIQPHLQEQNEDEMIYLGKAADMDIIILLESLNCGKFLMKKITWRYLKENGTPITGKKVEY